MVSLPSADSFDDARTKEHQLKGPPGTGKSTTTEIFCSHSVHTDNIVVTWISRPLHSFTTLVRLKKMEKKILKFNHQYSLHTILDEVVDKHIVVLDGFANIVAETPLADCRLWLSEGSSPVRKLVVVSSMGGVLKQPVMPQHRRLQVPSWTEQDYMEAISNNYLFESIKEYLDAGAKLEEVAGTSEIERRRKMLMSKYYFAGGFCRGLLEMSTEDLIAHFRNAIDSIHSLKGYTEGSVGSQSALVINRLIGGIPGNDGSLKRIPISQYVARELAISVGPSILDNFLIYSTDLSDNASVNGWFFEAKFFSMIRLANSTFELVTKDGMTPDYLM